MIRRCLPFTAVVLLLGLTFAAGGLEFLERRLTDLKFRLVRRPASTGVVVVDIDTRSLDRLGVWPWPRGYHATVLERLVAAGAERVGFDVDFSSRSTPEEDEELAAVLSACAKRVVLPVFQQRQQTARAGGELAAVTPLPELAREVELGSINVRPGTDGLVRTYETWSRLGDGVVPSFAAALVGPQVAARERFDVDFGIETRTIPRIAYVDALTGMFDPALVAGRAVIIGSTAVELGDTLAVPVTAALPGPLFQALAYESLAQERALRRLPPAAVFALSLLAALALTVALQRLSWRQGLLLTAATALALFGGSILLQHLAPLLLDTSVGLVAFAGVYLATLVTRIDQQALGLLMQRARLSRTESLMHHVVENSFDAVFTIAEDGTVETFNRAAQDMFGYPEDEIANQPFGKLLERDPAERTSLFARATGTPVETAGRRRDGRTFPVELVVTVIDTEETPKLVACMRDITERKAHQKALEHQATHDPLTDLPNRFLLLERIARAIDGIECGCGAAILLLDLDRFKEINDALGHHTGDKLLQQVALRLAAPLGPADTLARLGGDEFALLLPDTHVERARQISECLIEALRTPFRIDGLLLQVDTSIGVSMYPEHGADADTLIQRADVAMYVAKRKRTGVAIYMPDHDYNSVRHLMLNGDLRYAIQDNVLTLAYQPKISAAGDQVIGVEALVRWKHPRHGMIPPDEFIGLAEHSGLIRPLTTWVLETALRQAAEWTAQGRDLLLSVNVSARNLLEEDLPGSLERLLLTYGVRPECLMLEITESVLMEEPERSLEVITRLNRLGVEISIDDFGTGFSSLGYLMRLPARELKIDRSFVMQMDRDGGNATIVRSIIELAHNLDLKVVAEGVETQRIWGTLKDLGCDVGQGYYFSKPLPAAELAAWIDTFAGAGDCQPALALEALAERTSAATLRG